MKKTISVVVAIGIVAIFIAILLRHGEIADPRPAAVNTPKAADSPAPRPALSAAPPEAQNPSVSQSSPTSIPLIDRNNPAYATMIRALDAEYRSLFQQSLPYESRNTSEIEAAVRLLTTIRLSQMMHEATLATVIKSSAHSVTIAIPAYEAEGRSLQRYLEDSLHLSVKNLDLNWELTKLFDHFGRYKQEIEVRPDGQFRGETLYQIGHFTDLSMVFGGLHTQSNLPSSDLGGYGVFESLFPKS